MPPMQEILAEDRPGSAPTNTSPARRFFAPPGSLIWNRRDWPHPLGSLSELHVEHRRSNVQGRWFDWTLVRIDELVLERGAALLLLQGQRLTDLLIPNHELIDPAGGVHQVAHLLLRVDAWSAWQPVPKLTGLTLARLGPLPIGIPPTELLAVLATDSAPA